MRKFIIILFLLLFIPVISFSDLIDSDFSGMWASYAQIQDTSGKNTDVLYLMDFSLIGQSCYMYTFDFHEDNNGNWIFAPSQTSEYSYEIDGPDLSFKEYQTSKVILFTGRWSAGHLYISFDGLNWYEFTRSEWQSEPFLSDTVPSAFSADVYDKLEEGYEIPAGIYTIGVDIPAGEYEITAVDSTNIYLKNNIRSSKEIASFNLQRDASFGKITLSVGNCFSFSPGSIILKTYHGLFKQDEK